MNREKRLRRVGLLCCHFVRNFAYYRASMTLNKTKNEFWLTVQSNFIDIAVLEWLKLFGDHDDKPHWKKVVDEKESFKNKMLNECAITEDELIRSRKSLKTYRDQFIAHLDSKEIMNIPTLDTPLKLAKHYYVYVIDELDKDKLGNLPENIEDYFLECTCSAELYYGK